MDSKSQALVTLSMVVAIASVGRFGLDASVYFDKINLLPPVIINTLMLLLLLLSLAFIVHTAYVFYTYSKK